jgi:hypothetical protein
MMRCEDGPDRTGLPDTPRLAFADQTAGFEATDSRTAATRSTTDYCW